MKKTQSGFTLIELMIVVAIIAIPAYNNYITQAKINAARDNFDAAHRLVKNEVARVAAGGTAPTSLTDILNEGEKKSPFVSTADAFVTANCAAATNGGSVKLSSDTLAGASGTLTITLCDDSNNKLSGAFSNLVNSGVDVTVE